MPNPNRLRAPPVQGQAAGDAGRAEAAWAGSRKSTYARTHTHTHTHTRMQAFWGRRDCAREASLSPPAPHPSHNKQNNCALFHCTLPPQLSLRGCWAGGWARGPPPSPSSASNTTRRRRVRQESAAAPAARRSACRTRLPPPRIMMAADCAARSLKRSGSSSKGRGEHIVCKPKRQGGLSLGALLPAPGRAGPAQRRAAPPNTCRTQLSAGPKTAPRSRAGARSRERVAHARDTRT